MIETILIADQEREGKLYKFGDALWALGHYVDVGRSPLKSIVPHHAPTVKAAAVRRCPNGQQGAAFHQSSARTLVAHCRQFSAITHSLHFGRPDIIANPEPGRP